MDPLQTLRQTLIMFFLAFPMIMITLVGLFSVGTGSIGLFLLFVGQVVIVPVGVWLMNFIGWPLGVKVPATDLNQLVPSMPKTGIEDRVFPSHWVAHTTFFLAYLFWNAYSLYGLEPATEHPEDDWRVENRKGRATMIMLSSVFFLLFMLVLRLTLTNAEKFLGVVLGATAFGALAYGWQQAMASVGAKSSDVFGIVQQMVPMTDDPNITMCVPRA